MMEKQKEAESATKLMKATVSRIRATEESKKGLIITKALYGRFVYPQQNQYNSEQQSIRRDEVIDVTVPLQCLVKDSKLILYDASKVRFVKLVKLKIKIVILLQEVKMIVCFNIAE